MSELYLCEPNKLKSIKSVCSENASQLSNCTTSALGPNFDSLPNCHQNGRLLALLHCHFGECNSRACVNLRSPVHSGAQLTKKPPSFAPSAEVLPWNVPQLQCWSSKSAAERSGTRTLAYTSYPTLSHSDHSTLFTQRVSNSKTFPIKGKRFIQKPQNV